jgi:hypothetical protein
MTGIPWNAYYYDGVGNSLPPTRTELIEAESESDAAKVAKSHMGRSKRVEIDGPRWWSAQKLVILAAEDGQGPLSKPH